VLHQKTAVALHSLLLDAYEEQEPDHILTVDEWIENHKEKSPTFYFWLLVLNLEVLVLTFVRSQREGNYDLYERCLSEMLPWIFIFDHQNYSRWLPIHLRDLLELSHKAPDVHNRFKAGTYSNKGVKFTFHYYFFKLMYFSLGQFVYSATGNPFSRLAIDQAHEQNNAKVKDSGGVVGLTHDAAALRRVMIAGPEISRLLGEFPKGSAAAGSGKHHEQYTAYQKQFKNHCLALKNSFFAVQNPFSELGPDLITLDTREGVSADAVKTLFSLEQVGKEKFKEFVDKRIKSQAVSFYHPITKNVVKIFAAKKKSLHPNRHHEKLLQVKEDTELYWRLYTCSLVRDLDLNKFFQYENQRFPPALTTRGEMRSGDKAELVKVLEAIVPSSEQPSQCQGVIFDGAFLVHNVPPRSGIKTFADYFKRQLVPHTDNIGLNMSATRIDFVWDLYAEHSIKGHERDSRGAGVRKKELPEKGTGSLQHCFHSKTLFAFIKFK